MSEQWTDERIIAEAEAIVADYPFDHAMRRHTIGTMTQVRNDMQSQIDALRNACMNEDYAISQILGEALGYPRYCDDPKNFPGATEADGVCTGDHVGATLAKGAADRIRAQASQIETLQLQLAQLAELAIQQPTTPRTEADRGRCRQLMEENDRLHKQIVEAQTGQWIPMKDWVFESNPDAQLAVGFGGRVITVRDHIEETFTRHYLPSNVRLCRRAELAWLDQPTNEGLWAFEGVLTYENTRIRRIATVTRDWRDGKLYARCTNGQLNLVDWMKGKWQLLHIAWPEASE